MSESGSDIEEMWGALLSRDTDLVFKAYSRLTGAEQQKVREHLLKMVSEPGWHPEQRRSAETALQALDQTRDGHMP